MGDKKPNKMGLDSSSIIQEMLSSDKKEFSLGGDLVSFLKAHGEEYCNRFSAYIDDQIMTLEDHADIFNNDERPPSETMEAFWVDINERFERAKNFMSVYPNDVCGIDVSQVLTTTFCYLSSIAHDADNKWFRNLVEKILRLIILIK